MNLNIHPLFVHFPIALLTVYSGLEIISIGKLRRASWVFSAKAVLIILGGLSILATRQTGQWAAHLISDPTLRPLIREHEFYANIVTAIYGLIAAGYCFALFKKWLLQRNINLSGLLWKIIFYYEYIVTETFVAKLMALAGFAALLITGALGGSIVYGANLDPFTTFIYHLFFK